MRKHSGRLVPCLTRAYLLLSETLSSGLFLQLFRYHVRLAWLCLAFHSAAILLRDWPCLLFRAMALLWERAEYVFFFDAFCEFLVVFFDFLEHSVALLVLWLSSSISLRYAFGHSRTCIIDCSRTWGIIEIGCAFPLTIIPLSSFCANHSSLTFTGEFHPRLSLGACRDCHFRRPCDTSSETDV